VRIGEAAVAAIVFGCTAGVALPAFFAFPARSAPADVRLVTSIATTARKARGAMELIEFTVTVRSIGGSSHGVGVDAGIEPAAMWVAAPIGCRSREHDERLRCELGDVSGRTDLDLAARVPAATGASALPVLMTVTTTSSATTESTITSPSVPATAQPEGAESPAAESSASASIAPSAVPFAAPSTRPRPSASASPPAASPPAASRPVAPRPAGSRPATDHPAAAGRPGRQHGRPPGPSRLPGRLHAAAPEPPAVPSVPSVLVPSVAPPVPAVPPPAPMPSLPPVPPAASGEAPVPGANPPAPSSANPSDLSLVLPDLADTSSPGAESQSGKDPSSIDPPQMSIVRTDPVAGSRRAWVTVLGITIVFETAVLWLAACLSLWRRRTTLAQAASSGLSRWPRSVRHALWAPLARLPRVLNVLRR
jgi:hypothetical protein